MKKSMRFRGAVFATSFALFLLGTAGTQAQEKPEKKEPPVIALTGGTLIEGNGGAPIPDAVVFIQGTKILKAGPASAVTVPEKAERIDARGKYILPGFIDCHIHTAYPFDESQYSTDDDASTALRALHVMNLYLKSGVTSVRDVGSNVPSMKALVGAQALGFVDSIRPFACGDLITTTGGHGDGLKGTMAVDGPWAWRKAIRQMVKDGFGQIKISPPVPTEKRHWSQAMHETLFREARQRKILMGVGTDFVGPFMSRYPGAYFEEMKYFVELGVSPMEAIVAATKNGAVILGEADERGTIEAGKKADLQMIKGDPLKSFDSLGSPEIVFIDGKIHRF